MFEIRPVLYIVGILMMPLAVAMLLPAAVDFGVGNNGDGFGFLMASAAVAVVGGSLIFSNRYPDLEIDLQQGFLLVSLAWIFCSVAAAVPLMLGYTQLSSVDAIFEAVSGLTTTGSTVITGLDHLPPGLLLWRSMLQWLGGFGIIVMAVGILPALSVGGMQLFRMESSERSEKVLPRATQTVGAIATVYGLLTVACAFAYSLSGMTPFEALNHALTTIPTGGFSTSDLSMGNFGVGSQWVCILFMLLGGAPFLIQFDALRGNPMKLVRSLQVRGFLALVLLSSLLLMLAPLHHEGMPLVDAARHALFTVASVVTTTGFATTDYNGWGGFAATIVLFLTFAGACTGSTTGGIKVFRHQVVLRVLRSLLRTLARPHKLTPLSYEGRPLTEDVVQSVLVYVALYVMTVAGISIGLSAFGFDLVTAVSGAATAVGNVGPGLGSIIGPAGAFTTLPDGAKLLLCVGMLLGRLEFVTLLVPLLPSFWRY